MTRFVIYFEDARGGLIGRTVWPRAESVTLALRQVEIPKGARFAVVCEVVAPSKRVPIIWDDPKFGDSSRWEDVG